MKILVIGGAGYIGSHTCKLLHQTGHEVYVYDNLSTGHQKLLKWGTFIYGDILDLHHLRLVLAQTQPEGIIHFAGHINVGESVLNPYKYQHNNTQGSLNILEAMRLEHIKNLVVSSSCAVYGNVLEVSVSESHSLAPTSPYGFSKLAMEQMIKEFAIAYEINWVSLRYFNAAGADMDLETGECHEPETHLIPRLFMAAENVIPTLEIYGNTYPTPDGTCIRDYIHVADLASAHVKAMEYLYKNGGSLALNLGSGTGFSVKELLGTAENIIKKKIPHIFVDKRQGDPAMLVASTKLAKQTLGWTCTQSDISHILSTAYNWHCLQSRLK